MSDLVQNKMEVVAAEGPLSTGLAGREAAIKTAEQDGLQWATAGQAPSGASGGPDEGQRPGFYLALWLSCWIILDHSEPYVPSYELEIILTLL